MRINLKIQAPKVRVILEDGKQLGIISLKEALDKADEMNKDLVEIAPNASPPVCKIISYGKLKYQQTKKEKEGKKTQHQIKVKEIKVRPNIDIHDLETKMNRSKEFISKGNKVKITCNFRGREMLHKELGGKIIDKFIADLEELATIESPPKLMGKTLSVVLAPLGKKK